MVKWEYHIVVMKTKIQVSRRERDKNPTIEGVEEELNTLGNEGWELVGVQNIRLETGNLFTVAYLKRQTQDK